MDKKTFNPGKYGMIICPGCNGHGFIENHQGRDVCSKCGAFGFIKKVDESKENTEVEREVY
jgi:hypothetical protein